MEFLHLLYLTLVTSLDISLDIIDQHQPPKSKKQTCMNEEDTFVPKVIMSLLLNGMPSNVLDRSTLALIKGWGLW